MFISKHKDAFGVEPVCRVLTGNGWQIAPGTYYAAVRRPPPARVVRDAQILAGIRQMRAEYEEVYGARKMWLELNRRGTPGWRAAPWSGSCGRTDSAVLAAAARSAPPSRGRDPDTSGRGI